ncbi:hypothetical protein GCM10009757_11030 [Streptomyces cheonanensis]|uniref:Uncharacterized protein n=1 Tax=Streptomyces cheonanensis TaxID=312720 RepID=A0ABN2UW44_9ACTN
MGTPMKAAKSSSAGAMSTYGARVRRRRRGRCPVPCCGEVAAVAMGGSPVGEVMEGPFTARA